MSGEDTRQEVGIINQLEKLETEELITLKRYREDFCNIIIYPYNKTTNHFCDKVHEKNKSIWNKDRIKF